MYPPFLRSTSSLNPCVNRKHGYGRSPVQWVPAISRRGYPGGTVRIGVREGAGMQAGFNIFTDFNQFIVFDSTADLGDLYEKCVRVHR